MGWEGGRKKTWLLGPNMYMVDDGGRSESSVAPPTRTTDPNLWSVSCIHVPQISKHAPDMHPEFAEICDIALFHAQISRPLLPDALTLRECMSPYLPGNSYRIVTYQLALFSSRTRFRVRSSDNDGAPNSKTTLNFARTYAAKNAYDEDSIQKTQLSTARRLLPTYFSNIKNFAYSYVPVMKTGLNGMVSLFSQLTGYEEIEALKKRVAESGI